MDTGDYNSDEADDSIRLTIEDSGGEQYSQSRYPDKIGHQRSRSIQQISATNMIPPGGKNISKSAMENEKRMRREIANSNERRRMQSINAGFQSLRSLLPHHEGEKLSKAAILQQTSQYIIELEREKTHLLSQNSQLKRTLGQHELASGDGNEIACAGQGGAIKKRKLTDNVITLQTISDSSDEGLGSMSPEPVTLLNNAAKSTAVAATAYISTTSKELTELKASLETERKRRMLAEERLRQVTGQYYPATTATANQYAVHRGEVIEHTDNIREEHEMAVSIINDPLKLQVVEIDALPAVGQTQVVVCSPLGEVMDIQEDEVVETITEDMIQEDMRDEVIIKEEIAEYVEVPSRLQPILEAAIKAEPKVEVERINATLTKLKDDAKDASQQGNSGRMYLTSTSRQNLETIVEAIRHLEGDHLFAENTGVTEQQKKQQVTTQAQVVTVQQEVPLALTNKPSQRKQLSVDLSPFLQLKKAPAVSVEAVAGNTSTTAKSSSSSSSSISSVGTNNSSSVSGTCSNTTYLVAGSGTLKVQAPASVAAVSVATPVSTAPALVQSQSAPTASASSSASSSSQTSTPVTIAAALKQCRPGVIVAKQISS